MPCLIPLMTLRCDMNKNQIIQNCVNEISTLRINAQNKAVQNMMKAREIPEYLSLDKKERALTFEIGKLKAENKPAKEQTINLNLIKQEKEHVLLKNKINPNSIYPEYSCKICNDTGFVNGTFCKCLKNKIHEKIMNECGISKDKLHSFKQFSSSVASNEKQKTQLEKIRSKFEEISNKFPAINSNFIIISGKTGVGKTFMAECLASSLIEKGFIVSVVSSFGMNDIMLSYHTCFNDQKQSYLSSLLDPEILLVDDLGTEPILKNVTLEYLYLILSERSRRGHLTIITTNLSPNDILDRYNERIFSRIFNKKESLCIQIEGQDLRIGSKQ